MGSLEDKQGNGGKFLENIWHPCIFCSCHLRLLVCISGIKMSKTATSLYCGCLFFERDFGGWWAPFSCPHQASQGNNTISLSFPHFSLCPSASLDTSFHLSIPFSANIWSGSILARELAMYSFNILTIAFIMYTFNCPFCLMIPF